MSRVQVTFSAEETDALRQRAQAEGRSLSAVVREAVAAWLAGEERKRLWDRAIAAVKAGGFRSGLHDVSENHDEYFVQAIEERIGRR
jgi:Ribbon-helix-helix protein, copG family.